MSLFNNTRTVDFSNKTVMDPIKVIQGEAKARTVHFKLVDGGSVVDLTGCTVRAYILPHGETTPLYEDLTVINAVKGTCDYVVSGNAAATAGDAAMQLEVLVIGDPDPLATGYSKEMVLQVVAKKDFTGVIEASTVFATFLSALATMGVYDSRLSTAETDIDALDQNINFAAPIGESKIWEFPIAPAKHLLKIGQLVNRADYPDLWALASTVAISDAAWATDKGKFSTGNGSTTFRIPDWSEVVPVGYKSGSAEFGALGGTYGEKAHALTGDQNGQHTHDVTGGTVGGSSSTVCSGSPSPTTYGISGTIAAIVIASSGTGAAHNNIQPSVAVNYIIRALA